MHHQKRLAAVLMAGVMTVNLCSCAEKKNETDKPDVSASQVTSQSERPDAEEQPQPESGSETPDQSVVPEMLDRIDGYMTYETAGSSLKATCMAVDLLDWGIATELKPEEIKDAVALWMAGKGEEETEDFLQKMKLLDITYKQLLTEEAEHLLSDAGCEDAAYPWSDVPVESIEAMMEAVGLR